MKKATVYGLLLTLVVLAAAGAYLHFGKSRSSRVPHQGTPLLPDLDPNEVTRFRIHAFEGTATLEKRASGWLVRERYGYPADFARVAGFLMNLAEARIGQTVPIREKELWHLNLLAPTRTAAEATALPQGEGTLVKLSLGKRSPALDLVLGKTRGAGNAEMAEGGRYVRRADRVEALLTATGFHQASADPAAWLDPSLPAVTSSEVLRMEIRPRVPGARTLVLSRPSDRVPFGLQTEIPEGKRLDKMALYRYQRIPESLSFHDVADPDTPRPAAEPAFSWSCRDGRTYRLLLGDSPAGRSDLVTGRFEISWTPPESSGAEHGHLEARDLVERDRDRFGRWTYLFSAYDLSPLFEEHGGLLEDLHQARKQTTSLPAAKAVPPASE